jgi:hypothetical protein
MLVRLQNSVEIEIEDQRRRLEIGINSVLRSRHQTLLKMSIQANLAGNSEISPS